MSNVLTVTEIGMQNDVQRMHAISHNLANASTVGFKKEVVVARPFIDHMGEAMTASMRGEMRPVVATMVDHTEGTLKFTGNPLDVGVEGSGFIAVMTPAGEAFTRQGNFHVDVNGRLVTSGGHAVQGANGDILLTTSEPRIDSQGVVWENKTEVGQLKLVSVGDTKSLTSIGQGLYMATDATDLNNNGVRVRQGFTEAPNVVAMKEMINMIETVRHFEASQKLIRGYDTMLDRAINVIGDLS